jgi:hypothetical protein
VAVQLPLTGAFVKLTSRGWLQTAADARQKCKGMTGLVEAHMALPQDCIIPCHIMLWACTALHGAFHQLAIMGKADRGQLACPFHS